MVSLIQLLQSAYDELKVVVSANTGVSTPDDHVGVLSRTKDIQTPFFGFEWQQRPVNRGSAGNREVETTTTNSNGDTDGVKVSYDYDLIIDIGVVVDDDNVRQRDQYFTDVENHFSKFIGTPTDLHSDVERFRDQGAVPSSLGDERDVGVRKTYLIRYPTTATESLPPAETVDWDIDLDIDAGDKDVYPENY